MTSAILAIDQGTTNTKAILVDSQGHILAKGSAALGIAYPQEGWVEQDAEDIWNSVVMAIGACLEAAAPVEILGLGISNQRETVLAWNRATGTPLGPAITWQCRRTTETTEALKRSGVESRVLASTGLPLDPLFPASKIRWLLDRASGDSDLCVGTVDSWLIYKLTGGRRHATDRSNASRTQLLNLHKGAWDEELCDLFGVPPSVLPEVEDSQQVFGETQGVPGLPDGLPIASAIGDSHAALFGHAAFAPGDAKVTFGTGSSVMVNVPDFVAPEGGLTTTVAWSRDGTMTYALEGNILVSASVFPWTAGVLGLDGNVDKLMELAASVEDAAGVYLVPAHVGLGAPHWRPEATGLITGLRFSSTPAHVARAAAESMALQVSDVLAATARTDSGSGGAIHVDGGPSGNPFLMQLVADILGRPLQVCRMPEVSAFGAATLAGLTLGVWPDPEALAALDRGVTTVTPGMHDAQREPILDGWAAAVKRCAL